MTIILTLSLLLVSLYMELGYKNIFKTGKIEQKLLYCQEFVMNLLWQIKKYVLK